MPRDRLGSDRNKAAKGSSMTEKLNRRIDDLGDSLLECKTEVGQELEKGNIRMNGLSLKIDKIATSVETLNGNIDLLLKIFNAGKGFWTFSGWIGKFIIKFAIIGGSIATVIYFIKTGEWK